MTASAISASGSAPSVLLTGPTRGLGRALVDVLAARRPAPSLLLAGRDPAALARVVTVAGATGAGGAGAEAGRAPGAEPGRAPGAVALVLDLASLDSVRAAADSVVTQVRGRQRRPLTTVIANAGIQVIDRRHRSTDGLELTFAVNVLAQHLLLSRLRPALANGAHVVLVGSGTHFGGRRSMGLVARPRWEDPAELARPDLGADSGDAVAGQRAYATSKLALVLLAHAWQRRHSSIRVNVYDPGLMPGTGLARELPNWQQWAWRHVMPAMRVLPGVSSPGNSARHLAALALGDSHPDLRAGYVELGRVARSSPASYDQAREDRLWDVVEQLSGVAG